MKYNELLGNKFDPNSNRNFGTRMIVGFTFLSYSILICYVEHGNTYTKYPETKYIIKLTSAYILSK